jgi:hypothetical protein
MTNHSLRFRSAVVLLCACVASIAQAGATVGLNFTGLTNIDNIAVGIDEAPPDTMGSPGPTHFVQFLNGGFAAFDKSTGNLVAGSKISDIQFWSNAGIFPGIDNLSDPRIVYDPNSGRWFASQITLETAGNSALIARSDTADPTGAWKAVSFRANSDFADFPMLGVDADGIYLSTNNYDSLTSALKSVSVFSIPKADLLLPTPSTGRMTRFDNLDLNTHGFTVQPVNDFGPSKGHGSLIAVDANIFGNIVRLNIVGPGAAGATLSASVSITALIESQPPLARQPDGTQQLDSGSDNYQSSVSQVGNKIWVTHGTEVAGRAAIRWSVINEATHAVLQEGTLADPNHDLIYPSIAANQFGEAVIGFTQSGDGPTDFASAFAAAGTTDAAGVTTFRPAMLLKAGLKNYHKFNLPTEAERWGDYSATSVDPNDPHIFWTTQEFALSDTLWGTQVAEIIFPEPGMIGVFSVLVAAVACRRRR